QIRLDACEDFFRLISSASRNMNQSYPRRFENLINEGITFLTVFALVTLIIKFKSHNRLKAYWIAEQKVNVLTVNLVGVNTINTLVIGFYPDNIAEIDLAIDDCF